MIMKQAIDTLTRIWGELYPGADPVLLRKFIDSLGKISAGIKLPEHKQEWYKDAVVAVGA